MNQMKAIFLIIALLLPYSLLAQDKFAKVLILKGKASYLKSGAQAASWLKKGDFVGKHSSILTREKSFIRLKLLSDGSTINLGPESKVVLSDIDRRGGSVIGHLKGMLRTKVEKDTPRNLKLMLKTRGTVMAVRGTEFITLTNPKNRITTLVTLKGKVEVVKANVPFNPKDMLKQIDAKKGVVVKEGTATTTTLPRRGVPTESKLVVHKVNPKQLVALNNHKTFNVQVAEVPKGSVTKAVYADGGPAPKAGGFADYSSAIFIPPAYNENKNLGSVNTETGDYIPAPGVRIDEQKGFVADESNTIAMNTVAELNKSTGFEVIAPKIKEIARDPEDHRIGRVIFGGEVYSDYRKATLNKISNAGDEAKADGSPGAGLAAVAAYAHDENLRFKLTVGAKFSKAENAALQADPRRKDDELGFGMKLDTTYFFTKTFGLRLDLRYEQDFILIAATTDRANSLASTYSLWVPKFGLSAVGRLSTRFDVDAGYMLYADTNPDNFSAGSGHAIHGGVLYYLRNDRAKHLRLGVRSSTHEYGNIRNKTTNINLTYNLMFY